MGAKNGQKKFSRVFSLFVFRCARTTSYCQWRLVNPTPYETLRNTGSLGFAVMHHQFWRQLYCRPPAVQLLGQLPRRFPESQILPRTMMMGLPSFGAVPLIIAWQGQKPAQDRLLFDSDGMVIGRHWQFWYKNYRRGNSFNYNGGLRGICPGGRPVPRSAVNSTAASDIE